MASNNLLYNNECSLSMVRCSPTNRLECNYKMCSYQSLSLNWANPGIFIPDPILRQSMVLSTHAAENVCHRVSTYLRSASPGSRFTFRNQRQALAYPSYSGGNFNVQEDSLCRSKGLPCTELIYSLPTWATVRVRFLQPRKIRRSQAIPSRPPVLV